VSKLDRGGKPQNDLTGTTDLVGGSAISKSSSPSAVGRGWSGVTACSTSTEFNFSRNDWEESGIYA